MVLAVSQASCMHSFLPQGAKFVAPLIRTFVCVGCDALMKSRPDASGMSANGVTVVWLQQVELAETVGTPHLGAIALFAEAPALMQCTCLLLKDTVALAGAAPAVLQQLLQCVTPAQEGSSLSRASQMSMLMSSRCGLFTGGQGRAR